MAKNCLPCGSLSTSSLEDLTLVGPVKELIEITTFDDDPEEHMLAADAIEVFGPAFGGKYQAKQIIGAALRAGQLECFAEEYWETDKGDVAFDDWIPPTTKADRLSNVTLPPMVFRASKQWPEDFSLWKWETSEFVLFIEEDNPEGKTLRAHLSGVRLPIKAIEALVEPLTGQTSRVSSRAGIGGRTLRSADWTAFWHEIIRMAKSGELADFETQKALRAHVLEQIGDQLSEETIRRPVQQIWYKFIHPEDHQS